MDSNDNPNYLEAIELLSQCSDGQLATPLAEECKEFVKSYPHAKSEELFFLRNLRDKAVYSGGASGFVMQVFNALLAGYSETESERQKRHNQLKREIE